MRSDRGELLGRAGRGKRSAWNCSPTVPWSRTWTRRLRTKCPNRYSVLAAIDLVEGCANADLLLTGTVIDFESRAVAYDADDNVSEYRAHMTVDARLVRRSDGEVLWKERFRRSETYAASLAKSFQVGKESLAARIVSRRIGEDVLAHLIAVF